MTYVGLGTFPDSFMFVTSQPDAAGGLASLPCANALAQANNTSYTSDMPSVERVKAEIKGSDPTDTLARQVAVFTYLSAVHPAH